MKDRVFAVTVHIAASGKLTAAEVQEQMQQYLLEECVQFTGTDDAKTEFAFLNGAHSVQELIARGKDQELNVTE